MGNEAPPKLEGLTAEQIQQLEAARNSTDQRAIDELLRARNADIFVTAIPRNNQLVVRTADEQSMKRIRELIQYLDVPTPLVLSKCKSWPSTLRMIFARRLIQFSDGRLTSAASRTMSRLHPPHDRNILPPAADQGGLGREETLAPGAAGANPNQNLTFQIVSANFRMLCKRLNRRAA